MADPQGMTGLAVIAATRARVHAERAAASARRIRRYTIVGLLGDVALFAFVIVGQVLGWWG